MGDDIPSIFPIIAGVLIFILSITYIYQQVDQRNAYLEIRSATLQMSYIVTEKGLIQDAEFQAKCDDNLRPFASKKAMEFAAILKKYCGPVVLKGDENLKITSRDLEGIGIVQDKVCSSNKTIDGMQPEAPEIARAISLPQRDTIIMSYPVAVECGSAMRGIGMVSIIGWRKGR